MGYPQKRPMTWFCPRCDDSGARDRCTGFWRTQVRDAQGKKPVVHTKAAPLLLRLCIYRKHKKKTGENFCAQGTGLGRAGSLVSALGRWRAQVNKEMPKKEVAWRRKSNKSAPWRPASRAQSPCRRKKTAGNGCGGDERSGRFNARWRDLPMPIRTLRSRGAQEGLQKVR